MNMKFLKSREKKRVLEDLQERFGISEFPSVMIETGKEKIRGFSGNMTKEEIEELVQDVNVEIIGLYLFKQEGAGIRLSLDATQYFQDQIKKEIVIVNEMQAEDWLTGKDLDIESDNGIVIVKCGKDLLGCGVSNGKKVFNYIPKERRIRKS